ncbi:xanthine/uracil/vitamin C permease [Shewanella sediminis HAW-EB3]|uniref:Xanthine/uracil/vitamin C permease n=1 Tax=Shewanella sediminis (strain HAW-EB3) TaxID=425104 RepID=A8G0P2_SHESH|nr:putative sulfate/molybdate transporter [Shewanella sediminis]ABV38665.1 xanthine/uracil/vitamin C permease [Shewanella sediminis HAW-EB3]
MTCKTTFLKKCDQFSGEFSGAFADLGTFLPLVLGLIALNHFSPQGIFMGFGVFALFTAFYYRRPIPVQPMKVIAALVIAQGLTPGMLQASGMMMGVILLILAFSGAINWMAKQLSPAVSIGIQLAIGIQLMWMGAQMMSQTWLLGLGAFTLLFCSRFLPLRYLAMPLVIIIGMLWQYHSGSLLTPESALLSTQASMQSTMHSQQWSLSWPTLSEWSSAAVLLVLPQLALTLTNAVIATSAMAKEKFPGDREKFTPKRLATSSGLANLLLTPFGATAMCHGAGGLAVQHHFGARGIWAPVIFGSSCLLIAFSWGENVAWLLGLIPLAILGSLLSIAGLQLAWSKRLLDGKPFCILVILSTAAICLLLNTAAGLAVGVILEMGRRHWRIFSDLKS